ncbi:MAG: energy-coupling factor transporter transmembrane protein EcfT [Clostridia bacterium]|nr:energy-coupling factor transporter transmembrane protein EcfT [Clostridia bacterium]
MKFVRYKRNIYPLIAIIASVTVMVFALISAKKVNCSYYLLGAFCWIAVFGCVRQCARVLPAYLIVGGAFSAFAYLATKEPASSLAMANRLGAIFLAGAIGMSVESVAITRNLSQLRVPRSITLGMLISTSFTGALRSEVKRVRESMKTRGAGSLISPAIFYRAFLIPFVTRLVKISDTLSLSVETRGYDLSKVNYTVYKKESVALSDLIFLIGIAAGGILTVAL